MKVPVTVLIPIKNEAQNLPRCLASVSWADSVIIIDSQSTDGSMAIAEAAGATVVQFAFNGVWPKKKNWALENVPLHHEWVFILDADEVLPPEAEAEFRSIVCDPNPKHAGYWINRRFMFMGKWLRHAYFPNWNLRLFQHRLVRYQRLTHGATNTGDNEVHEPMAVQGTTARLHCLMDHYAFPTVSSFIQKHDVYSNWEAWVEIDARAEDYVVDPSIRRRRRLRRLSRKLPFRPLLRFCYVYFWQLGCLDGREGYYFARLHAVYEFLSIAKVYELRHASDPHSSVKHR